ncbi:MAG: hypothetical protein AAB339_06515 [Elusimicrobiota bacterium]
MRSSALAACLLVLGITAVLTAAGRAQEGTQRLPKVLEPGRYRAAVSGVLCEACMRAVLRELRKVEGIVEARFAPNDRYRLFFSVEKGASLRLSRLQRAMRSATSLVDLDTELLLTEIRPDIESRSH